VAKERSSADGTHVGVSRIYLHGLGSRLLKSSCKRSGGYT